MVQKFFKTLAVSALVAAAWSANAQSIPVVNGSFESPPLNDGTFSLLPIDGWTGSSDAAVWNPNVNVFGDAYDGSNDLGLRGTTTFASQTIGGLSTSQWGYSIGFWVNGKGDLTLTNATAPELGFGTSLFFDTTDWEFRTLTFRAANTSVAMRFNGEGSNTSGQWTFIDNVTVSAVPEPESYAMLLAGLGAIGFMSRRRRSS